MSMLLSDIVTAYTSTCVTPHLILSPHLPTSLYNTVLTNERPYALHCNYNIIINYIEHVLLTKDVFSAILTPIHLNF